MKILLSFLSLLVVFIFILKNKNEDISKVHYRDFDSKLVYDDIDHAIEHLLARDENHVHPNDEDKLYIEKATLRILDAQKKDPNNINLAKDLIHINYHYKPQLAIKECKRILTLDPNQKFMIMHLAHLQALTKDYKNAIINASKLKKDKKYKDEVLFLLGYCYFYLRQKELSLETLTKIKENSVFYNDAKMILNKL